jgi:hypothetical protein
MRARAVLALVAIVVGVCSPLSAEGNGDEGGAVTTAVATVAVRGTLAVEVPVEPWIHPTMPADIRAKLDAGLELAAERLREVEACYELFTRLGVDGFEMLSSTRYLQVGSHLREVQVCKRNVAASSWGTKNIAFTKVRSQWTWICRDFARVPDEAAAVAVIHEALHRAGLSEWPSDRLAMTSEEITRMVKKKCEF